ncbi:hepatic and glial cell adhesion molecule-like [Genypterus blacodes]|uniref:hepatic and glial cell adhesion molecule-like n=1 Tax=Genypterus blacodes TaxID=154954 RepID=UPI003F757ED3
MACFAAAVLLICLFGFVNLSGAKDACDLYGTVGQSVTVPYVYEVMTNTDQMRWTHNKTIVFYRELGRVTVGKPTDVSVNGSLLLKNLKFSSAGIYQVVVLNRTGAFANRWMGQLCVQAKVSKPEVKFVCDTKASIVMLTCNVAQSQGLEFSWTLDEKVVRSETKQTMTVALARLKGDNNFTCSVANKVSNEKSSTVRLPCKSPTPPPLVCFPRKTVLAALAGGVCLILILIIIIVVIVCLCRRRNKALISLNVDQVLQLNECEQPFSTSPDYEIMNATPTPSPAPSPRPSNSAIPQFESQPSGKLEELSAPAEVKEPSPVPKPRRKAPN